MAFGVLALVLAAASGGATTDGGVPPPAAAAAAPAARAPAPAPPAPERAAPPAPEREAPPAPERAAPPAPARAATGPERLQNRHVPPPYTNRTTSPMLDSSRSTIEPDREALPYGLQDIRLAPYGPAPPELTPTREGGGPKRVQDIHRRPSTAAPVPAARAPVVPAPAAPATPPATSAPDPRRTP